MLILPSNLDLHWDNEVGIMHSPPLPMNRVDNKEEDSLLQDDVRRRHEVRRVNTTQAAGALLSSWASRRFFSGL